MAFSFYQSLRTIPYDLDEASRSFQLVGLAALLAAGGALRHAGPDLEHDDVDVRRLVFRRRLRGASPSVTCRSRCPASAPMWRGRSQQRDLAAVGWAIAAMTIAILIYDQLLFRPLVAWADKFRVEQTAAANRAEKLVARSVSADPGCTAARPAINRRDAQAVARARLALPSFMSRRWRATPALPAIVDILWYGPGCWRLPSSPHRSFASCRRVHRCRGRRLHAVVQRRLIHACCASSILIVLASLIWVPIGVTIGLRPKLAEKIQPVAQFLAAFPANLLFPVAVVISSCVSISAPNIWLTPADDPRHAMVHPRSTSSPARRPFPPISGGGGELPHPRLAMVARGHAAGIFPIT